MNLRGPSLGVALTAFAGVCALADVSPLLKLRPPSPALAALTGSGEGGAALAFFAAFALVTLAAPVFATWCLVRTRLLPTGRAARFVSGALLLLAFAAIRALSRRAESLRAIGRGSDQATCIEMPARALAAGHWPYDRALIWSGNACSPGLGWIALAAPFVLLLGYASFLVAGGVAFVVLPARIAKPRDVAAFLLLSFSCIAAWQSLVTGADDLAIGIGFALVTILVAQPRFAVLLGILAGLVATARLPFAFFPLLLAAFLYRSGERTKAAHFGAASLATLAIADGAPFVINAPSYLADGPFHVLGKGERIEEAGGAGIFVLCGFAWLAYAGWSLVRAPGASWRHFHVGTLVLLCVAGPALADLVARACEGSSALQAWQGGNWLLAALPSYAASLAFALSDRAPSASPPAGTSSLPAR